MVQLSASLPVLHDDSADAARPSTPDSGIEPLATLGRAVSASTLTAVPAPTPVESALHAFTAYLAGDEAALARLLSQRHLLAGGGVADPWLTLRLGVVLHGHGELDDAGLHLAAAAEAFAESGDRSMELLTRSHLAALAATGGEIARAWDEQLAAEAAAAALDGSLLALVALQRVHVQVASVPTALRSTLVGPKAAPAVSLLSWRGDALDALLSLHVARLLAEGDGAPRRRLSIGKRGEYFQVDGAVPVECRHRPVLRRILVALAEGRIAGPGVSLSPEALIDHAWPNERMSSRSARARLHTSMCTLRQLGLGDLLVTTAGGYHLATTATFEMGNQRDASDSAPRTAPPPFAY